MIMSVKKIESLQKRIIKVITKTKNCTFYPLLIKDSFKTSSVLYDYEVLKSNYWHSKSITRHKVLNIPKINKSINFKNYEIVALKLYNEMPNDLKELGCSKKTLKARIIKWYRERA